MKLNVGTQVDMGLTSKISWHIQQTTDVDFWRILPHYYGLLIGLLVGHERELCLNSAS